MLSLWCITTLKLMLWPCLLTHLVQDLRKRVPDGCRPLHRAHTQTNKYSVHLEFALEVVWGLGKGPQEARGGRKFNTSKNMSRKKIFKPKGLAWRQTGTHRSEKKDIKKKTFTHLLVLTGHLGLTPIPPPFFLTSHGRWELHVVTKFRTKY